MAWGVLGAWALAALMGCDGGDGGMTDDDAGPPMVGTDAGPPTDTDAGEPMDDAGTSDGWTLRAHPCVGNRTDTLWVDDDGTMFVGCGSTTSGDQGFYFSQDEGVTWDEPPTSSPGIFDSWRVHDISRSGDGLLYVAGRNTLNSQRVVRVDTSAMPWTIEQVFDAGSTVAFSFEVGGFRRDDSGRAVAESSTGTGIIYRERDAEMWTDVSDWDDMFGGLQLLQLTEHGGQFYGCGSTISAPPRLYIPSAGSGFGFQVITLAEGAEAFDGEMWGLDVDDTGIVVGGVDQGRDVGRVYTLALDGTPRSALDVATLYPDDATWIRGVCRNGADVVAVGEQSRSGRGIVLRSSNDGAEWTDITPPASQRIPPVHRCVIRDDGTLYVAGANGTFATL